MLRDIDGVHRFDYFADIVLCAAAFGESYPQEIGAWFSMATIIIRDKIEELKILGRLKDFSK